MRAVSFSFTVVAIPVDATADGALPFLVRKWVLDGHEFIVKLSLNSNSILSLCLSLSLPVSLSLCLAKQLPNLALKKKTNQSSAELGHRELSAAAVDGCRDSYFSDTCCTKTEEESKPWWSVNLQAKYNIVAVTIISSNGSYGMLRGAEVRIGDKGLRDSYR